SPAPCTSSALAPASFPSTTLFRSLGALRARRCSHVSRACLRCCRVNGPRSAAEGIGSVAGGSVMVTVCVRKRLINLRRVWHRLRSEEHTSELQSRRDIVCRLLLEN